jgi:hypothetical protein
VGRLKDCMSFSGDMQDVCAIAILNLTEDSRNHQVLLQGGVVETLLKLLQVALLSPAHLPFLLPADAMTQIQRRILFDSPFLFLCVAGGVRRRSC